MAATTLPLYVSAAGWVAPAPPGTLAPLGGAHAQLDAADWAALARTLRSRFGIVDVQAVLSTRLCRFLGLPWLSTRYTGRAIRAYVDESFAAAGVGPDTHRIEIDWPQFGEPIFAAAYPRAPMQALRDALHGAGLGLATVESSLGPVLRQHGGALGAGPALLGFAEDDGVAGVTIEAGRVVQVETLPPAGSGLDDLGAWYARKQAAFADDEQLRWLDDTARPDAFAGAPLPAPRQATAGQARVAAWR